MDPETPTKNIISEAVTPDTPGNSPPSYFYNDSLTAGRPFLRRTRSSARLQEAMGKSNSAPDSPLDYKSQLRSAKNEDDDPPAVTSMNYIYPCSLVPTEVVPAPDTLADGLTHNTASRGGLETSIRRWRCCECSAVRPNYVRVSLDGSGTIGPAGTSTKDNGDNKDEENMDLTCPHPCLRCGAPACDECVYSTFQGDPIFTRGGRSLQPHWETPAWFRCAHCQELTLFGDADTFHLLRADFLSNEGCTTIRCDTNGCGAAMQWDAWVYNDTLVSLGTFDGRVVARNGPWARHAEYHARHRERPCGWRVKRGPGLRPCCKRGSCVDRERKEVWYMPWKGFVRKEKMEGTPELEESVAETPPSSHVNEVPGPMGFYDFVPEASQENSQGFAQGFSDSSLENQQWFSHDIPDSIPENPQCFSQGFPHSFLQSPQYFSQGSAQGFPQNFTQDLPAGFQPSFSHGSSGDFLQQPLYSMQRQFGAVHGGMEDVFYYR
jgi:hypothetical protein